MPTIIYSYGLKQPIDWSPQLEDQLYLQNRLWNRLVEIERAHGTKLGEASKGSPQVLELRASIEVARAERDQLRDERDQTRIRTRSRPAVARLDEAIERKSALITTQVERLRDLARPLDGRVKERISALQAERRAAIAKARNEAGLWTTNSRAIVLEFERACKRLKGQPQPPSRRDFRGEGRFVNLLANSTRAPDITAGQCSGVVVDAVQEGAFDAPSRGERSRRQRTHLSITAFVQSGKRRMLRFPMMLHRPLPANALIRRVDVERRRKGARWEWMAHFHCDLPESPRKPPSNAAAASKVAIVVQSVRGEKGLRVATAMDAGLQPEHCWIPGQWLEDVQYLTRRREMLRQLLSAPRRVLSSMDWTDAPRVLREKVGGLNLEALSSARLARIVLTWREQCPDWNPLVLKSLERWRKRDKRWLEECAHLEGKLFERIRDHLRRWANAMASKFDALVISAADPAVLECRGEIVGKVNRMMPANVLAMSLQGQSAKFGAPLEVVPFVGWVNCPECRTRCTVDSKLMHVSCSTCLADVDWGAQACVQALQLRPDGAVA